MKVLFINTLYSPHIGGGAEITLQSIVEGIKSRGVDVAVLTTFPGKGVQIDEVNEVKVYRVGIENIYWHHEKDGKTVFERLIWHSKDILNSKMATYVEKVLEDFNPDIVNCHNLAGFSASAWRAIKNKNKILVQVLHDTYSICPNSNMLCGDDPCEQQCLKCGLFRYPHKELSKNVDCVVGVSEFVLKKHIDHGLFSGAKISRVINNARKISPLPLESNLKSEIVFGFIGTLVRSKGVEHLLQAFHDLDIKNSKLIVAGRGESSYVDSLKKMAGHNVEFVGYAKPADFFSQINILVVPSLWNDTFPGVVFEAFSYGVPVIGSKRGGIPEMVQDGVNGFLFEPSIKAELPSIMEKIVRAPELISDLKGDVLRSAIKFTDVDSWIGKYLSLFNELIEIDRNEKFD